MKIEFFNKVNGETLLPNEQDWYVVNCEGVVCNEYLMECSSLSWRLVDDSGAWIHIEK